MPPSAGDTSFGYEAICLGECESRSCSYLTADAAVAAWNRRAHPSAPAEGVTEAVIAVIERWRALIPQLAEGGINATALRCCADQMDAAIIVAALKARGPA